MNDSQASSLDPQHEAALLRAMLRRLFTVRAGGVYGHEITAVAPGELPGDLPFTLPLPPQYTLIGSLSATATHEGKAVAECDILYDTPLTPAAVFALYGEHLDGWIKEDAFPQIRQRGGFQPTLGLSYEQRHYMHPHHGSLQVQIDQPGATLTGVHLKWRAEPFGQPQRRHTTYSPMELLPSIYPPTGAQQMPEGGGGGMDRVHTEARVVSNTDLAALAAHYTDQLNAAGWQSDRNATQAPFGWSTWHFRTTECDQWHALLTIFQDFDHADRFRLHLEAHSTRA